MQDYVCPLCDHKRVKQKMVSNFFPFLPFSFLAQLTEGCRVQITNGKFRGCVATVLSKQIGTHIRVKFNPDSPLPGSVVTLHIKKLEADESLQNESPQNEVDTILTMDSALNQKVGDELGKHELSPLVLIPPHPLFNHR